MKNNKKQNKGKGLKTVEHFVLNGNAKPIHLTHVKSRHETALLQLEIMRQFALANPMVVKDGFDLNGDISQRKAHPTDKNVLNIPLRDNYCLLIGIKVLDNLGELYWVIDGVIGSVKANQMLNTIYYTNSLWFAMRKHLHLALGMDSEAVLEGKCRVGLISQKDEEIQPLFVRWIVPVLLEVKDGV